MVDDEVDEVGEDAGAGDAAAAAGATERVGADSSLVTIVALGAGLGAGCVVCPETGRLVAVGVWLARDCVALAAWVARTTVACAFAVCVACAFGVGVGKKKNCAAVGRRRGDATVGSTVGVPVAGTGVAGVATAARARRAEVRAAPRSTFGRTGAVNALDTRTAPTASSAIVRTSATRFRRTQRRCPGS